MTTNEREAFENFWKNEQYFTSDEGKRRAEFIWNHAWQARAALDQRHEVTDEMVDDGCKHPQIESGQKNGYYLGWCTTCGLIQWCSDGGIPDLVRKKDSHENWCFKHLSAWACAHEASGRDCCKSWCGHKCCTVAYKSAALQSIAQPVKVPDGWPHRCTPARFLERIAEEYFQGNHHAVQVIRDGLQSIAAMLAAAPEFKP